MGVGLRVLITLVVVFVGFQLIPYGKQINPKYDKKDEIAVDKDLKSIFKRSCMIAIQMIQNGHGTAMLPQCCGVFMIMSKVEEQP